MATQIKTDKLSKKFKIGPDIPAYSFNKKNSRKLGKQLLQDESYP